MAILDIGRVVRKTRGRDAGVYYVVVEKAKDKKIVVEGVDGKRTVSIRHVEPLPNVLSAKGSVVEALKKEGFA